MAEEEIHHPDGRIEHPSVRSEPTDVSFRGVMVVLAGGLVIVAIALFAVLRFFHGYNDYQSTLRESNFPLAPKPSYSLPPEPRLEQLDRLKHIEKPNVYLRELSKEAVLQSYGKTDEEGYLHVPIERAIKYLAGKLPARKETPRDAGHANGLVDYGQSNSGRLFRKESKWSVK